MTTALEHSRTCRVLQVTAEIFPVLKTGGLADVVGALPLALRRIGVDTRVVVPGFPAMLDALLGAREIGGFQTPWGDAATVLLGQLRGVRSPQGEAVLVYVVKVPPLFDRAGGPYEDTQKQPYGDNHRRFAALCWAAAHVAQGLDPHWQPDVLHTHDWHAGLTPAILKHWHGRQVPTVHTVHNLAYQGLFGAHHFPELGLPLDAFQPEGVEFWGQISFMKAGLHYANHITTVSPTYALEIQTPEQGFGLDGLLRARSSVLTGILNGVDPQVWSPALDPLLPANYSADNTAGKAICKQALQEELGLLPAPDVPLLGVVSRLTEQKGLPLVLEAAHAMVTQDAQLVVLGSGDHALEQGFRALAQSHPGQIAVHLGYDEALAHRVFGGTDITLVPSRFEPCGLTQLYGLAYGSLPLVRHVGGLADTVVNTHFVSLEDGSATGFVFQHLNRHDFDHAVSQALALYRRPVDWARVRLNAMRQNHAWDEPARQYARLYERLAFQPHSH